MLWSAFELRGAEFLWIEDLSKQDALIEFGFEIPLVFFTIDAFNVLPILMALAMLVSQRMTPTTVAMQPQQKMIMNIMPVMFSVFLYNYAAGLNLYILTSTLLGIGQNMLVRAQHVELTPKEQKPKATAKKRPQHFYHAAQAKKKEMAKDARKAKEKLRAKGSSGKTGLKKRS
jgi:YidC/Oxa1 family membrane protein insertase